MRGAMWVAAAVVAATALQHLLAPKFPVPDPKSSAVFITGTSTGIGRHAAVELACLGYLVFAGVRQQQDAASIADEAATRHCSSNLVPVIVDVSSHEQVLAARDVVADVLERTQASTSPRRLAAIVANAGISVMGMACPVDSGTLRRNGTNLVFAGVATRQVASKAFRWTGS